MRPNEHRSRRSKLLVLGIATVLAACTVQAESNPDNKYACQTEPCLCVPEQLTLFNREDTVPILWKENGDAYCPEGHVLKRVKPDE